MLVVFAVYGAEISEDSEVIHLVHSSPLNAWCATLGHPGKTVQRKTSLCLLEKPCNIHKTILCLL